MDEIDFLRIELCTGDLQETCFDCGAFYIGIPALCPHIDCQKVQQINRRPVLLNTGPGELIEFGYLCIDPPIYEEFGRGKYLIFSTEMEIAVDAVEVG